MQMTVKGAVRAEYLNEIRLLRTFRIGSTGMKVELYEVWFDADAHLAWIVCNSGTWRLPEKLLPWAKAVEERAEALGFGTPWPCWALFEESPDGEVEVEIFPDGYRPVGR